MFNAEKLHFIEQDVDGTTVVDEHPVKLHFIDTGTEDESEMT
jgi:hypothetical protein